MSQRAGAWFFHNFLILHHKRSYLNPPDSTLVYLGLQGHDGGGNLVRLMINKF